jgi:ribonuclease HI
MPHRPPASPRLFSEPPASSPADLHTAEVDGASRGNPGPAAYAVILRAPDGAVLFRLGKYIGRETNNVAEYYALISALDAAVSRGVRRLRVRSDSELMVRQMKGAYRVKSPDLKPLHERARKLAAGFEFFSIEHVLRERNREADALANAALDSRADSAAAPSSASQPRSRRRIRARFSAGVLVPAEPLDLPEGSDLDLTIEPPSPRR